MGLKNRISMKEVLTVQGFEIKLLKKDKQDFISLTDMARKFNDRTDVVIQRWMRNRNTIEFLAIWEKLNNDDFNPTHLDGIRGDISLNSYVLSVKQWISMTSAIGIESRAGRYGGTYAHKDIAMEFGTWLSPVFKMYLIQEFQSLKKLKAEESKSTLEWDVKRVFAKANYHIHREAVHKLLPTKLNSKKKQEVVFANEADLLNLALFGINAKEWAMENPELKGNIRDYASSEQLLVMANLESLNSKLIEWDCDLEQRFEILQKTALKQLSVLGDFKGLEDFV